MRQWGELKTGWSAGLERAVTSLKFVLRPIISGEARGLILGPFINDLDDGTECTLSRFTDDAQLEGLVDRQYGCAAIQRDLDRLGKWANRSPIKFNKGKSKVLHLGRNKLVLVHPGGWPSRKQIGREGPWALVNKLTISQQYSLAARRPRASWGALGRALPPVQEGVILHLYWATVHQWEDNVCSVVSSPGLPVKRETCTYRSECSRGSLRWLRARSI